MWDGKLQGGTHLTANMSSLQTKMHILEVMENPQKTKHFFQPLKMKENTIVFLVSRLKTFNQLDVFFCLSF